MGAKADLDQKQQYMVGDYVYVAIDRKTAKKSGCRKWSQVGRVWQVRPPECRPVLGGWRYRVRLVNWCVDYPCCPSPFCIYAAAELKRASRKAYIQAGEEVAQCCANLYPGQSVYERQGSQCDRLDILVGPFSRLTSTFRYTPMLIEIGGTTFDVDRLFHRWGEGRTDVVMIGQVAGRPPRKVRVERAEVQPPSPVEQDCLPVGR